MRIAAQKPKADFKTGERALNICPHCSSPFVQPVAWRELSGGLLSLRLRCPECFAWMAGTFSKGQVASLDRAIRDGRACISREYRDMVHDSMHHAVDIFVKALERDLICADDFATSPHN